MTKSDQRDPIAALWADTEPVSDADLRRLFGDCQSCLDHGSLTPGIGTERAVWRDADGRYDEGVRQVCPDCLEAAHGGPGYYPVDPPDPTPPSRHCEGCDRVLDRHAPERVVHCGRCGEPS